MITYIPTLHSCIEAQNYSDNEYECFLNCLISSPRITTRKTIFCMWPTVMRVSMGSEWWKPSRWEHLDLGVGEGCEWDSGNEREGSHYEGDRR
jgi:hypothetical protein